MIPARPTMAELRRGETLWGPPRNGPPAKPKMRLISWKPLVRNSLRGFATVELPIGLKIADIAVNVSNGRLWAALPSKPVLDQDGRHKVDINNKRQYVPLLEWRS